MNKLILCTALILISLQGGIFAQTSSPKPTRSKTDITFNPCVSCYIHIKDIVYLKEGRMIIDLNTTKDYVSFHNMDSLLISFRKAIAFYKDSLEANGTGHVRIDYVINPKADIRKIRFKKYPPDGSSFVEKNGDVSMLKLEQDTVRIILEKEQQVDDKWYIKRHNGSTTFQYAIQATFLLNNYTDVDKLIADKAGLKRIIDTMEQAKKEYAAGENGYISAMTTFYKPYATTGQRYRKFASILNDENDYSSNRKSDYLTGLFNMGVGLTRNTFTPSVDLGLQIIKGWPSSKGVEQYRYYSAFLSANYFFSNNSSGDYLTHMNVFANFMYGTKYDTEFDGLQNKKAAIGIGYLIHPEGNYFKKTTLKVFMEIQLPRGITVCPELIATNDFKQIFPGITVKLF